MNIRLTHVAVALLAGGVAMPATAQESDAPIAIQTYSLRDLGGFEAQMQAVSDAGVSSVETFGMDEADAEETRALLDEYGIEVISEHVPLERLRSDMEGVITFAEAVGNDTITVPYLPEEMRPDDAEGWRELGEELSGYAEDLAAEDLRLAYHNHDFEMVEYDGRTGLEILFEAAGPDVLAEIDLAWVDRGGQDPAEFLRTIGERVFAVHAKDNASEGENEDQMGFSAVGAGTLDWDAILEAADEVGVEWYIVEHDQPADPAAVVAEGAEFLRGALSGTDG